MKTCRILLAIAFLSGCAGNEHTLNLANTNASACRSDPSRNSRNCLEAEKLMAQYESEGRGNTALVFLGIPLLALLLVASIAPLPTRHLHHISHFSR